MIYYLFFMYVELCLLVDKCEPVSISSIFGPNYIVLSRKVIEHFFMELFGYDAPIKYSVTN